LKTESGELSHNIEYTASTISLLLTLSGHRHRPRQHRNPLAVVTLLPGAAFATDNTLRHQRQKNALQFAAVASRPDATNGSGGSDADHSIRCDAIQEVSISNQQFRSGVWQAGGGYFNYTMKSGTNQFHGSAYDYFNNTALMRAPRSPMMDRQQHAQRSAPERLWVHRRRAVLIPENV